MLVWQGMLVARYVEPGKPCHQTEFPPTARGCGPTVSLFGQHRGSRELYQLVLTLVRRPTASW
jgi:hypothetical protein